MLLLLLAYRNFVALACICSNYGILNYSMAMLHCMCTIAAIHYELQTTRLNSQQAPLLQPKSYGDAAGGILGTYQAYWVCKL